MPGVTAVYRAEASQIHHWPCRKKHENLSTMYTTKEELVAYAELYLAEAPILNLSLEPLKG